LNQEIKITKKQNPNHPLEHTFRIKESEREVKKRQSTANQTTTQKKTTKTQKQAVIAHLMFHRAKSNLIKD